MSKKTYNKLVRDNIPAIIRASGGRPKVRILESDEELFQAALAKVVEEAKELQQAKTKEDLENELADLREIIDLVMKMKKLSGVTISRARIRRGISRGRFKSRTFLISVEEPEARS